MIKNIQNLARDLYLMYNPLLTVWLLDLLFYVRAGNRQLLAVPSLLEDEVWSKQNELVTREYNGLRDSDDWKDPLVLVMELIPPSVMDRINDTPGAVGSLDEYTRIGAVGGGPGLPIGIDLTGLQDDETAREWFELMFSSFLAASLYKEMKLVGNAGKVGSAGDRASQALWFRQYAKNALIWTSIKAGFSALASQFPEVEKMLESVASDTEFYFNTIRSVPTPSVIKNHSIQVSKAMAETLGYDNVYMLPDLSFLDYAHVKDNFIFPGVQGLWEGFSSVGKEGERPLSEWMFPGGMNYKGFATVLRKASRHNVIGITYFMGLASISKATGVYDMAAETLASAASSYQALWSSGDGSIGLVDVSGLPDNYLGHSGTGDHYKDTLNALLFGGIVGGNEAYLPTKLPDVENLPRRGWQHVEEMKTIVELVDTESLRFIKLSGLSSTVPIYLPNESVEARDPASKTVPWYLTQTLTGYAAEGILGTSDVHSIPAYLTLITSEHLTNVASVLSSDAVERLRNNMPEAARALPLPTALGFICPVGSPLMMLHDLARSLSTNCDYLSLLDYYSHQSVEYISEAQRGVNWDGTDWSLTSPFAVPGTQQLTRLLRGHIIEGPYVDTLVGTNRATLHQMKVPKLNGLVYYKVSDQFGKVPAAMETASKTKAREAYSALPMISGLPETRGPAELKKAQDRCVFFSNLQGDFYVLEDHGVNPLDTARMFTVIPGPSFGPMLHTSLRLTEHLVLKPVKPYEPLVSVQMVTDSMWLRAFDG